MGELKGAKGSYDLNAIKTSIQKIAGTYGKVDCVAFDAIVQAGSQNLTDMTCYVDSVDSNVTNLSVRFMLESSDGEINVPLDSSLVTVILTSFTDPYIVKSTELKSKTINIGTQSWDNDGSKQSFQTYVSSGEGSFGGFVKIIDPNNPMQGLLKKLNNIENKIDDLIIAINGWIPVPNDGGAALKVALTTWLLTSITPTTQSEIENPNLVHGLTNLPS
jgi:hypothetical protein